MVMPRFSLILFVALALSCSAFAQLTPDQEASRDKGLGLYQQHINPAIKYPKSCCVGDTWMPEIRTDSLRA